MGVRHLILVLLLAAGTTDGLKAQLFDKIWYFGNRAGLDFRGFDPFPLDDGQTNTPEGVASVCDSLGNILFYTDGVTLWDGSHQRFNGSDLSGDTTATHSATIVPDPGNPGQYFVFTTRSFTNGGDNNTGGNYYTVKIDENGQGSVLYDYGTASGKGGFAPNSTEKFAALAYEYTPGKIGYWFLMHEFGTDRFIKVRRDSVWREPVYQAIGSIHQNDTIDDGTNLGAAGQMKFNDVGTRLAVAVQGGKFFEIFRFRVQDGMLSNSMQLPAGNPSDKFAYSNGAYGVEFSPTGRYGPDSGCGNFLYGTSKDGGQVYQWDLSQEYDLTFLIKSCKILYSNPEIRCGDLQIAPNGKIYVAFNGQDFLGVINSPMRTECKFEQDGARLVNNETNLGGTSGYGLPAATVVPRRAEPFYFENLCFGDETLFYISDQLSVTPSTQRVWVFKKVGGGTITRNSTLNDFRYKFPTPGEYEVTLNVFISGRPQAFKRELTINPIPVVQLAEKDTVPLCRGSVLPLDAGFGAFYEWEDVRIRSRTREITTDSVYPLMEYRVKMTDYHGCVGWDTVWVERKIPPTIEQTSSIRAFCGNQDGSATVIPFGTLTNFDYRWEGFPEVNSNTLTGLGLGDYVVHVISKSNKCEAVDTIHVDELGGASVKIIQSGDPVICPGETVELNVTGAAEVTWQSHPELSGTTVRVSPETTTIYTVRAISRDEGRECPTVVTDTVEVFPKHIPDLGEDRTACAGLTVEIDGGGQYEAWEWSNGQNSRIARVTEETPNLVLVAKDFNGCSFSASVGVHFKPAPVVDLGRDTAVCALTPVILSGGKGESYLWSTGETTQTIRVDRTGDYSVTISEYGCSLTDTVHVQINDPSKFTINSVNYQDISCFGANNGRIEISASGDGRDFWYSVDNGKTFHDNGGIFENLPPSTDYRIVVLEDSVCRQTAETVKITEPDTLVVKACTLPPSCTGCTDGQIRVASVTGGTPPYVIRLNDAEADTLMTGLAAGAYTLTVTDSNECVSTLQLYLEAGMRPAIEASVTGPVCTRTPVVLTVVRSPGVEWINPPGASGNEITVIPDTTTVYRAVAFTTDADGFRCELPLEYRIEVIPFSKPELGEDIYRCEGDSVRLDGGDYAHWDWSNGMETRMFWVRETVSQLTLEVVDWEGCTLRDTVSVFFSPPPSVNLGEDRSACTSEPLMLTGGTGDSYLWSTGAGSQTISVLTSGEYWLTIEENGCSATDTVRVHLLDPQMIKIEGVATVDNICYGGTAGSIRIDVSGTASDYRFSIDDGVTYQSASLFEGLASGSGYRVRVQADSLCYLDYDKAVVIGEPDSIRIGYRLKSPTCETCSDGQLRLNLSGGTPPYAVTVNGAPADPVTVSLPVGSYTVMVTDANGCAKSVEFTLELLNVVPNVITANGDGINDRWLIPMLKYYPDAVVKVVDVSGRLVFESEAGYPVPWDGRYKNNPLPMGTYYYIIALGPGERQLTGYLTILR